MTVIRGALETVADLVDRGLEVATNLTDPEKAERRRMVRDLREGEARRDDAEDPDKARHYYALLSRETAIRKAFGEFDTDESEAT